jgi:hypothetical protein
MQASSNVAGNRGSRTLAIVACPLIGGVCDESDRFCYWLLKLYELLLKGSILAKYRIRGAEVNNLRGRYQHKGTRRAGARLSTGTSLAGVSKTATYYDRSSHDN